jgi:hypothetical protein
MKKSESIIMTTELKKIKSDYYFKIPKAISRLFEFDEKSIIEVNIKKLMGDKIG